MSRLGERVEIIDLGRSEVLSIQTAAAHLVAQCGSRRAVYRAHGISEGAQGTLLAPRQPWRIARSMLERLAAALDVPAADILGGKLPPAPPPRKARVVRVESARSR